MEDALMRLHRLAQEEARMAAAQVWKVANTAGDRARELLITTLNVDNRVAYICSVAIVLKCPDKSEKLCDGDGGHKTRCAAPVPPAPSEFVRPAPPQSTPWV
jgi:hypothetical protein